MATTNNFANTPRSSGISFTTANTNRDGTGTVATIFTAGSSGSRIERIMINATGTTTAGMLRLFVHDGTAFFLWEELPVPAITPSATVATFKGIVTFGATAYSKTAGAASTVITLPGVGMILPNGHSLRISTHNGEAFHANAVGGDF